MLMIQVYMVTIMRECTVFVVRRRDVIRELLWYFDGTSLVLRIYHGTTFVLLCYCLVLCCTTITLRLHYVAPCLNLVVRMLFMSCRMINLQLAGRFDQRT